MKKILILVTTLMILTLCLSCVPSHTAESGVLSTEDNKNTSPSSSPSGGNTNTSTSGTSTGGNTNTSTSGTPTGGNTSTSPTGTTGTVYKIVDYYNADGNFSALGLTLETENSERVLKVKAQDVLVVGTREYTVTAQSLTVPFYTQLSLARVIEWWIEYCDTRIDRGEMK